MKSTNIFCFCLIFIASFFSLQAQTHVPMKKYHTVLKIPHLLSGSFAEPRSNHFHSGIDIKTKGKVGYRIYSIDSGYVSRIKVSPWGYGYAIYVNHPEGITSVYGHLSKYSDKIKEYIKKVQYEKESFSVDHFPEKDALPVEYGEILGLSGNSGSSGGPHLHFEVRDTKTERPFQPIGFGVTPIDTIPPRIQSLVVFPLRKQSLVNGKSTPQRFEVVYRGGAYYTKGNPKITITGKVGVGFQAVDYTNGSWSKCGIEKAALIQGSDTIYSFVLDDFSFAQSRYINAHMNFEMYKKYHRWVHQMFRLPGNYLDIYTKQKNDGGIESKTISGSQKFSISIVDPKHNGSKLFFELTGMSQANEDTTEEVEPISKTIPYDQKTSFTNSGFAIEFPKGSVYESVEFSSKITKSQLSIYPVFSILNENVPLHKSAKVVLDGSFIPLSKREQMVIGYRSKNTKKFSSAGGDWNGDSISTSIRSFGEFTLIQDSIPPTIRSLSIKSKTTLSESNRIRFQITDNFAGVKSVRGTIDGKWILLEHDGKTSKYTYIFDYERMSKGKRHSLNIEAIDAVGNTKVYNATFWK